jgi:tetratricopeptide (TPR) repeat protein
MYRLVQLAVKSWVRSRQETVRWQTTALLRVSEAFPTSKFENWGECQSLLLHAKTVLDYHPVGVLVSNDHMSQTSKFFWTERASLLEKTGSFLQNRRGLFLKAEVMFREALDIREKILGASHEDTLKALETLGGICLPLGRPVEAEAPYRQLLERRKLLFEPRHRDTIIDTRRLGVALATQGKFVEAGKEFRDVYNSRRQSLGPTHDITLTAVNNLGYLQFNQGNFDAAVETLRLAVEDSKAALGENHPSTLVCMSSLTDALRSQGDLESAEHYGRPTLWGREELYGKDHLETLESQYILAHVFLQHERYKEAEQAHNQVLRRRIKALEHIIRIHSRE